MATSMRRNGDGMSSYLAAIRVLPRLTRAEEYALSIRARAGDAAARDRMVRHSLGLVVSVVRKLRLGAVAVDDVIQEGNLGLLRALESFDPEAGTRFATYAIWWIRAYVGKFVSEARSIVRPRGGSVAPADVSLDAAVHSDDETTFVDRVEDEGPGPEAALATAEAGRELRCAIDGCRKRVGELGWDIVQTRIRTDEPHTLEVIGARWGLSRERVRQVELRTREVLARCLADRSAA